MPTNCLAMNTSNFAFLEPHDEQLVRLGMLAERYFSDDPVTSLIKTRQFGELLAKHIAANLGLLEDPEITQHELLGQLNGNRVVGREVISLFHEIRKTGNRAAHELEGNHRTALNNLKLARQIGIWFHRTFKHPAYKAGPFLPPPDPEAESKALKEELARLREERDAHLTDAEKAKIAAEEAQQRADEAEEEKAVWEQLAIEADQAQSVLSEQLKAIQGQGKGQSEDTFALFAANAEVATNSIDLDEAATRQLIDQQIRDAGWEADTQSLRYSNGTRPAKGRMLAIAEWPTESGPVDYILFHGTVPLATVEAKRESIDVPGVLEQAKRYSRDFLTKDECQLSDGPWGEYRIPFAFATNARPFLQQLRMQSGIWGQDLRRPTNLGQPMDGWYSPEGLREQLKIDIDAAEEKLDEIGFDLDFTLRPYQRTAILKAEEAIKNGQRAALLAMATGTGKTKTCIALLYRLLKAQRFRRILFLVDRNALGEQAANSFKDTRLESLQSFPDIFDMKEVDQATVDSDTKLHIATIQGMVRRLLFAADDADRPTVDQYDCIIVDECHRGYLLDRELSDTELTFRDQSDYVSKYRRVLEYFDAVKIGLTATPALHTTEIFGAPIYTYTYREAVLDDYLVDHEPPTIIETDLAKRGIKWQTGEEVTLYNTKEQALETAYAPDEIEFDVGEFNKKVLTEPFNKVVCSELVNHIDPQLPGKTLIFCATDRHADIVVDLLKRAYQKQYGEIEDDAIKKITGASDNPLQLIRRYKNEQLPNVAVTVDLLTTGIDVPEISNLVFLRRVNSRILYEQMLGRATRKCDEIGKEVFHIFDAVDLYSHLSDVSTMKPVVHNPNISYKQLIQELTEPTEEAIREQSREELLAKFIRKHRRMSDEGRYKFEAVAEMSPADFIEHVRSSTLEQLAEWFVDHADLGELLDRKSSSGMPYLFISEHEDKLVEVRRGYGRSKRPDDYLESFSEFIRANRNRIPALTTVLTRPRELTRKELKTLALELEKHEFDEKTLALAWKETTNEAIAARIIGYIRQAALGDALISYDERVDAAVRAVKSRHNFNAVQSQWFDKIANQMKANLVVDPQSLNEGYFRAQAGGFSRLNKVFDGELANILAELNESAFG